MTSTLPIQAQSTTVQDTKDSTRIPQPYQIAPPGWRMRGDAWWLLLSLVGRLQESKPHQGTVDSLSPAHFDPLEGLQQAALAGQFRGGMSTVQIIRYHSSPIGPYDELLMVPGSFDLPAGLGSNHTPVARVTRIYVSTLQSVFNGRRNWNVPKHLARFEFTNDLKTRKMRVNVYALEAYEFDLASDGISQQFKPKFATVPFFSTIVSSTFGSSLKIPMRVSLLPFVRNMLVQPPLEEGDTRMGMVKTDHWKTFSVEVSGNAGVIKVEGGLVMDQKKKFGDGIKFPDFVPYQLGLFWEQATIDVSDGVILSDKPTS